jgi:hypothetical protein
LIYKPQREMKKLERMDGKLFERLKPSQLNDLSFLVGGECLRICSQNSEGCEDVTYCDSNVSAGDNEISDMVYSIVNGNDETIQSDWNSPDMPNSGNNWDIEIAAEQYIHYYN